MEKHHPMSCITNTMMVGRAFITRFGPLRKFFRGNVFKAFTWGVFNMPIGKKKSWIMQRLPLRFPPDFRSFASFFKNMVNFFEPTEIGYFT